MNGLTSGRYVMYMTCVLFAFSLVACGGSDDVEMQDVDDNSQAMQPSSSDETSSAESNEMPSRQSGRSSRSSGRSSRRSSGGSVNADEVLSKHGIQVTDITTYSDQFGEVTLNGALVIKSMKIPEDGGIIEWPKDDEGNSLIWFESLDLKKAIDQKITQRETTEASQSINITSFDFNKYEGDTTRGFVTVVFNEVLEVDGITLNETDNYWIGWPAEKGQDGEYYDQIGASDSLKQTLNKKAVEAYESS